MTIEEICNEFGLKPDGDTGWSGYARSWKNPKEGNWDYQLIVSTPQFSMPKEGRTLLVGLHGDDLAGRDETSVLGDVTIHRGPMQMELLRQSLQFLCEVGQQLSEGKRPDLGV